MLIYIYIYIYISYRYSEKDTTTNAYVCVCVFLCVCVCVYRYFQEEIVEILKPCGDYTRELLDRIVMITGAFSPFFPSGTKTSISRYLNI